MSRSFSYLRKIRFADTDPAGIVFYPRYFEMVNEAIEDWFAEIGISFSDLHLKQKFGVPLVHAEADFFRPGRLGEELELTLKVADVGRSSFTLEITAAKDGEPCFKTTGVLAYMNLKTEKAEPLPDQFRETLLDWKG